MVSWWPLPREMTAGTINGLTGPHNVDSSIVGLLGQNKASSFMVDSVRFYLFLFY
jgi:hypothetical protein